MMRALGPRAGFVCRMIATWRHTPPGSRIMVMLFGLAALVAVF